MLSLKDNLQDNGAWRSLVARLTGGQEVAGSNPVAPTMSNVHKDTEHSAGRSNRKVAPTSFLSGFAGDVLYRHALPYVYHNGFFGVRRQPPGYQARR